MPDNRVVQTPIRASLLVFVVAAIGLFIYEATKSILLPGLTLWQSHSVTIVFGSVVAALGAYCALHSQASLHRELLTNESERFRIESDATALRASEARYRQLVEQSPDATAVHRNGRLLYANPACLRLLGVQDLADVTGSSMLSWIHTDDRELFMHRMSSPGANEEHQLEPAIYQLVTRNREIHNVEVVSVRITHDGERAVQTVLRDVTEKTRLERELYQQAFHDALTGLSNRTLFRDRVDHALQRLKRSGDGMGRVVVLFLDLDHFKTVNDSLGHAAGDALLGAVAKRLLAATRGCDSVARLGGDEFAVLLEDVSAASDPLLVAERIVECMREPFPLGGTTVSVGISVGIASASDADETDPLLRNADLALYAAKQQGRGRHVAYDPSMHAVAVQRLMLEADLRPAVERLVLNEDDVLDEIRVVYQPVVDLNTSAVTGVEALLRWTRPNGLPVPPNIFVPIAEDTGLIVQLGRWVLYRACRQAVEWEALGAPGHITMGVNLSRRQFQEPDFVDDVSFALTSSGLEPSRLMLEITEGLMMDDASSTLLRLRALKALGVRLAVDDFGTGYSSLSYLRQFPIDILKIDKSFIDGVANGGDHSVIANAIVTLGAALSLTTIAEGIEDLDQLRQLQALGCERGQGYFFSHPLSALEITEQLREPHNIPADQTEFGPRLQLSA
ncbi:MAG: EAL domain-containing protein [Phycisphaerae bacterium]|nr:EAL domain-containing protein [Gemmatimonadaceae bacterium]